MGTIALVLTGEAVGKALGLEPMHSGATKDLRTDHIIQLSAGGRHLDRVNLRSCAAHATPRRPTPTERARDDPLQPRMTS